MKKIILTTVAILTVGFVNAQDVKFGVKGGVNFANLTGDIEDASMKVGFHVGGFAEVKVSDKFSVQPELLFSTQGAKNEFREDLGSGNSYSYKSEINLSYLNVPVMAKFYVIDSFSLEAGLQIGFLMAAKQDFTATTVFGGVTTTESEDEDVKDEMKSIDFGLNVGAGYNFTENLNAGIRYNIGLSDISDEDEDDTDIKNSVLSLSLGYKF